MVVNVLFVCLGNICRSPAAEGVFKAVVDKRGTASKFFIDSCGTGGGNPNWYQAGGWSYHEGDCADSRMMKEAKKRGYSLTSRSRPLHLADLQKFDYIICMENANRDAVFEAAAAWGGDEAHQLAKQKVSMMVQYCKKFTDATKIPDPWYEGGFDHVLDLLEDACDGLYEHIKQKHEL